jgi:hypothetical protein
MYYSAFNRVHSSLGLLMIVFDLSIIVSVTKGAPFLNLEKLMFSPLAKSNKFCFSNFSSPVNT